MYATICASNVDNDDVPHVPVIPSQCQLKLQSTALYNVVEVMGCVVNSQTGIVGSTRRLPTSIVSSSLGISL